MPSGSAYPTAEAFLEHCERPSIESRAVVFHQGERSEDPYLSLDSSVSVIVDNIEDPEHEMAVNCLNPGEFFGEMELFDSDHRTATPSHTPCDVVCVSYQDFHLIQQLFPDVLYALITQMGQRLKNTTR
ncbi:MAG: cyclic nucleotide-binding domain-containing protein [Pseudomonadota bacterium]|nr:cyclic nucleotide-binding domain-containing protein [Pseudomonadota bacterium]